MKKQPTTRTRLTLSGDDYSVLDYLMGCYPQGSELEVGDLMSDLMERGLVERVEEAAAKRAVTTYRITSLGARAFGKYNHVVVLRRA